MTHVDNKYNKTKIIWPNYKLIRRIDLIKVIKNIRRQSDRLHFSYYTKRTTIKHREKQLFNF